MMEKTTQDVLDALAQASQATRDEMERRIAGVTAQVNAFADSLHTQYTIASTARDATLAEWRAEDLRLHAAERATDLAMAHARHEQHYALQARMHRAEIAARLVGKSIAPGYAAMGTEAALEEADRLIAACAEVRGG